MKYCEKCGRQMPDEARFCPGCGAPCRQKDHARDPGNRAAMGYIPRQPMQEGYPSQMGNQIQQSAENFYGGQQPHSFGGDGIRQSAGDFFNGQQPGGFGGNYIQQSAEDYYAQQSWQQPVQQPYQQPAGGYGGYAQHVPKPKPKISVPLAAGIVAGGLVVAVGVGVMVSGILSGGEEKKPADDTKPQMQQQQEETMEPEEATEPLRDSAVYSIELMDDSMRNENGDLLVTITYEKVVLEEQWQELIDINAQIQEDYGDFYNTISYVYDDTAEEWEKTIDSMGYGYGALQCTATAEVTTNSEGIFSIRITRRWFMGGVMNVDSYCLVYDLQTGGTLALAELSPLSHEEFLWQLKDSAARYLSEEYGDSLWGDPGSMLSDYTLENLDYYIEGGQIFLTFPTYTFGPGALGSYIIPTGIYADRSGAQQQPAAPEPTVEEDSREDVLSGFSSEERRRVNIFLSNFAELYFNEFDRDTYERIYEPFVSADADGAMMVEFVIRHNELNNPGKFYDRNINGTMTYMTLDEVITYSIRFFDMAVSLDDAWNAGYHIDGERICWETAAGATYTHFLVADKVLDNGDGTYEVHFTIYDYLDGGHDYIAPDRDLYAMTADEAKAYDRAEFYHTGVAVITPYDYNGKPTYQLIRYQLNEPR